MYITPYLNVVTCFTHLNPLVSEPIGILTHVNLTGPPVSGSRSDVWSHLHGDSSHPHLLSDMELRDEHLCGPWARARMGAHLSMLISQPESY